MIFVAPDKTDNSTLGVARTLVDKRKVLGLPCYGIVAIATGSQAIIDEADFEANGIDAYLPCNLSIRIGIGNGGDDSAAVADFGNYINVAETMAALLKAPTAELGIQRMIDNDYPGLSVADKEGLINRIPGIAAAKEKALKAWVKA